MQLSYCWQQQLQDLHKWAKSSALTKIRICDCRRSPLWLTTLISLYGHLTTVSPMVAPATGPTMKSRWKVCCAWMARLTAGWASAVRCSRRLSPWPTRKHGKPTTAGSPKVIMAGKSPTSFRRDGNGERPPGDPTDSVSFVPTGVRSTATSMCDAAWN